MEQLVQGQQQERRSVIAPHKNIVQRAARNIPGSSFCWVINLYKGVHYFTQISMQAHPMEIHMIRQIEELSLNAWAANQTVALDGWILRFTNGYTRRANCVIPLYPGNQPLTEKISSCEDLYTSKNLPVIFKMTSASQPADLDGELANRGYIFDAETSVQALSLASNNFQFSPEVDLRDRPDETWFENLYRMAAITEKNRPTLQKIFSNIIPTQCYASIRSGDQIIACGLGVMQSGYIGLFDIITDPHYRNQGCAHKLIQSLLAWGQSQQTGFAYLQVMLNNLPALGLYQSLGFIEKYRYWYRVKA